MNNLTEKLINIQSKLVAPKSQYNNFGKYSYRKCEDILEALKPLLKVNGVTLVLNDYISSIGDRFYVQATATLSDGENTISVTAYAREALTKKGMDESQITGASSSYARKYALNGLFCIDDTQDADTMKHNGNGEKITNAELNLLRDALIAIDAKEGPLCKYLGVETLEDLPKADYRKALSAIEARKNGGSK